MAVRDRSGSFADAGAAVAALGLGFATVAPVQARLLDRLGHRRVLPALAVVHVAAVIALDLGAGSPLALAFVAGAASPQISASMRGVWQRHVDDSDDRLFVLGIEAVAVEVTFLVAPAAVSLLLVAMEPAAAMVVLSGLTAVGSAAFAWSAPSVVAAVASPWSVGPLRSPGLRALVAATVAFGIADGIVQVAVPSASTEQGAGLLLTVIGVGTVGGGLLYTRTAGRDAVRDFAVAHVALAAALAATAVLTASTATLVVALLLVGLAASPVAIANSRLLARVTDHHHAIEAYAWLVVAVAAGGAVGAATGGWLVDHLDVTVPYVAASVAAAVGGGVAWAWRDSLGARD